MIIFSPRLENYQFSQPRYIFLIYDSTIYVFSMYQYQEVGRKQSHLATQATKNAYAALAKASFTHFCDSLYQGLY